MKRINFDYNLMDNNGLLLKRGHINYSFSHYIYALYQKTYLTKNPNNFWNQIKIALNSIGLISSAFVYNHPLVLNKAQRIGAINLLHAFGYFAFKDFSGNYPIFKLIKKRVYLIEPNTNQAMKFCFKIPNKLYKSKFSKLFLATYGLKNSLIVDPNGTFKMKIIDPVGKNEIDNNIVEEYKNYKMKVFNMLGDMKTFEVNFDNISLKIYFSKGKIPELESKAECYSDDEIYVYVENLIKDSNCIDFINK